MLLLNTSTRKVMSAYDKILARTPTHEGRPLMKDRMEVISPLPDLLGRYN